MSNDVAEVKKQEMTFSDRIMNELVKNELALPKGFNKQRFVMNAISVLNDNPKIREYSQTLILSRLMQGAILDLDFYSKECYLIPYGSQLNFQSDYKGKKKLVKKYSTRPVKEIEANIIRDGDVLEVENNNGNVTFSFKPNVFSKNPVVGAFAYATYEDGNTKLEIITIDELETIRKQSKAQNSMAWKDFTNEMYKKCAINRLCKTMDMNFENAEQRNLFMEDTAIETDTEKIVENEIRENANSEEFVINAEEVK